MVNLYIEYSDGITEVEKVSSWKICDGCLVKITKAETIYIPLTSIQKFIPNYVEGEGVSSTKVQIG